MEKTLSVFFLLTASYGRQSDGQVTIRERSNAAVIVVYVRFAQHVQVLHSLGAHFCLGAEFCRFYCFYAAFKCDQCIFITRHHIITFALFPASSVSRTNNTHRHVCSGMRFVFHSIDGVFVANLAHIEIRRRSTESICNVSNGIFNGAGWCRSNEP